MFRPLSPRVRRALLAATITAALLVVVALVGSLPPGSTTSSNPNQPQLSPAPVPVTAVPSPSPETPTARRGNQVTPAPVTPSAQATTAQATVPTLTPVDAMADSEMEFFRIRLSGGYFEPYKADPRLFWAVLQDEDGVLVWNVLLKVEDVERLRLKGNLPELIEVQAWQRQNGLLTGQSSASPAVSIVGVEAVYTIDLRNRKVSPATDGNLYVAASTTNGDGIGFLLSAADAARAFDPEAPLEIIDIRGFNRMVDVEFTGPAYGPVEVITWDTTHGE
jgi:hypothetical protein